MGFIGPVVVGRLIAGDVVEAIVDVVSNDNIIPDSLLDGEGRAIVIWDPLYVAAVAVSRFSLLTTVMMGVASHWVEPNVVRLLSEGPRIFIVRVV